MTAAKRVLGALALVALVVWFVAPLLPLALWAGAQTWSGTAALPQHWGTGNLVGVLASGGGAPALRSLALGSTVAALATPAGALAGRLLAQERVRAPRLVSAVLFAPVAMPLFAAVMGLNITLLRLHVPGWLGITLVLSVAALPYTTFLMRAAYSGYDSAYEDEARSLGASPHTVRWQVRLPLLAPALAGAAFLAFLVGWSDYIVTLLIGGGQFVTLPILIAAAASGTGNEPTVAALSLAVLAPPSLLLGAAGLVRRRYATPRDRLAARRGAARPRSTVAEGAG